MTRWDDIRACKFERDTRRVVNLITRHLFHFSHRLVILLVSEQKSLSSLREKDPPSVIFEFLKNLEFLHNPKKKNRKISPNRVKIELKSILREGSSPTLTVEF